MGQTRKGAKGSLGFENWVFWYHNNKADIENLKKALYSRVSSENPLFVVGGANGQMDGGLHLRADPGTPMANVMLTLMHRLGLEDMTSFGDSTGAFSFDAVTDQ